MSSKSASKVPPRPGAYFEVRLLTKCCVQTWLRLLDCFSLECIHDLGIEITRLKRLNHCDLCSREIGFNAFFHTRGLSILLRLTSMVTTRSQTRGEAANSHASQPENECLRPRVKKEDKLTTGSSAVTKKPLTKTTPNQITKNPKKLGKREPLQPRLTQENSRPKTKHEHASKEAVVKSGTPLKNEIKKRAPRDAEKRQQKWYDADPARKVLKAAIQAGKVENIGGEPIDLELMYPLIGAFPERRCLEPDFSPNSADEQVRRGGPNGLPVYDGLGFELDYELSTRRNKPRSFFRTDNYEEMIDRENAEKERKREILGSSCASFAAEDRISRDLNIPFHEVGMEEFEEWQERGFRIKPGELDVENLSKAEDDRLCVLATGSAFRKGSKRGQ